MIILENCGIKQVFHKKSYGVELQRYKCDIGRTTYEKYENGELNIRISVLVALREIYDCKYDDFFEGLVAERIDS